MEPASVGAGQLIETSKRFVRRLITVFENRLQLLMVEVQEEREFLFRSILLAFAMAVFGLLAGITLSAAIVILLWDRSPVTVLLVLTGLYALAGICLWWRLTVLLREWQTLSATLDQLGKDRACLEKILE